MRWYALGVDYEMAGKDLIDSVKLSSRVARVLGADPPAGFNYELFLDENGQKISKTKGNGLTIEQWLAYASPESLALFMFQKPTAAKRLYFDVIPRTVDDYLGVSRGLSASSVEGAAGQSGLAYPRRDAAGARTFESTTVTDRLRFLSRCCSISLRFPTMKIRRFFGGSFAATILRRRRKRIPDLIDWFAMQSPIFAISSLRKSVIARPTTSNAACLRRFRRNLRNCPQTSGADEIQHALYDIARPIPRYQDHSAKGATAARPGVSNEFFNMIYAVLLGESRGPRLGSFIAIYGVDETRSLSTKR